MNERLEFQSYLLQNRMRWYARKASIRVLHSSMPARKINGKYILTEEEGNIKLGEMLRGTKPFSVVRYGGSEMAALCAAKKYKLGIAKQVDPNAIDKIQRQSGFFPGEGKQILRFLDCYEKASGSIDFLGIFGTQMENYWLKKYIPSAVIPIAAKSTEPFYFQFNNPWSKELKGKRVLVIHPFSETIKSQYGNRDKLFEDKDVLPEFELYTVKAVQTIVGTKDDRFETWFDALQWMFDEAMKIDFQVAILGCGAYGLPLTTMLRDAGKQAIYVGGGTQLLFGIKGKRWDSYFPEITAMYNDFWVRPSAEETPKDKHKNEDGGAYW